MSTPQPTKSRAKSIEDAGGSHERSAMRAIEKIDWLTLWAISLGLSAIVLAGLAFYGGGDSAGASIILFGAAAIVTLVLRATSAPGKRR